ncbi:hypothetical protein [Gracilimonas mengyeensis]|uniref:Uncharacterized protein n=1 Tax=Gracilimonas mengyeensis TaxID=1302730 RepID=A0A521ETJ2_9BACT|nr:hypothetical protein [Gracilimonas mengyeensis]SMO87243.1 hypothetical protein SAMN06265219_113139 [Gracilimonas mengyeensis]
MENQFKVWYLPSENRIRDLNLLAMKDSGLLTFEKDGLKFEGKNENIYIKNFQSISYGKQGRDFVNNWVKIEYLSDDKELKTAFFADKKMLGWSGIFGGTKNLYKKIKTEFQFG